MHLLLILQKLVHPQLCLFLWNKLIISNCDLVHSGEFTGLKTSKITEKHLLLPSVWEDL